MYNVILKKMAGKIFWCNRVLSVFLNFPPRTVAHARSLEKFFSKIFLGGIEFYVFLNFAPRAVGIAHA